MAVLLALAALHFGRPVFLPFVAGLLIASLAWPAYDAMKGRIPGGLALLATVLLVTAIVAALFGTVGWGAASVVNRIREQPERVQSLERRLNAVTNRFGITLPDFGADAPAADTTRSTVPADDGPEGGAERGALAKRIGVGIYTMLGYLALAIGFAALTLSELPATRDKALLRFGDDRGRKALAIGAEVAQSMRRYLKVKSITSVLAGVSTGAISLIFGIEFAALWAFLAFLFEYVPTIGSILAVVPPVAYALVQFDSLTRPFVALGVLTVAQLFLGNYIDPRIEGRLLSLSPLVVLLSIVFWAWLWGAPGSLLGVPIVVTLTVIARHFDASRWIWALLTEPHDEERDQRQRD